MGVNDRSLSGKSSIVRGFLSSPIRVFYSILFICALEVGVASSRVREETVKVGDEDDALRRQRSNVRNVIVAGCALTRSFVAVVFA
jgi:hypothetical protein